MIAIAATPPAAVDPSMTLYDRQRDVHYAKPLLRGWQHLVWFCASLVLAPITLAHADGAVRVAGLAIYTATVSVLFGASALYHRGNWTGSSRLWLQRLDHVAIYLLIAGTATPVFLDHDARGGARNRDHGHHRASHSRGHRSAPGLDERARSRAWGDLSRPRPVGRTCATGGVGSSWAGWPAVLIIIGGGLYLVGALSFYRRRPDPSPGVFGYHEVFHAYVCAAAACQYVAVVVLIA